MGDFKSIQIEGGKRKENRISEFAKSHEGLAVPSPAVSSVAPSK